MVKSNTTFILLLSLLGFSLLMQNCNKDEEETPTAQASPLMKISSLNVTDIGDAGNGSDLQIRFSKVADESNVMAYRVFVVNSSESSGFDLAKAEAIPASNFSLVTKTGNDLSTTLSANSKTSSGELIRNDVPYKIFVMTTSNDPLLFLNALSTASAEIRLSTSQSSDPKVKVTYIANDGVMIEYEGKKVAIDAINRASNLGGWISPSNVALTAVENGSPPYDNIDIIMITHNHGDHYSTSAVQNYLTRFPNTKLIIPSSMESSFSSHASQIVDLSISKFERVNLVENDISIDVLQVEHFDQFGNNFSTVESFAYLVRLGDKKFLHAGDLDYVDSQLDTFNLLSDSIDVAFIPTFGDLVSTANRDAIVNNVNPKNIICLHFLSNTLLTTINQVNNIYTNADVFRTPFETREY